MKSDDQKTVHLKPRRIVKSVDCVSLFNGDEETIDEANEQMEESQQVVDGPPVDISTTFSCKDLIEQNGYIMDSLTSEEKNFPIAYSILVFKDPQQIERLLHIIYRPQNFYCIHVDLKSPNSFFLEIENISKCFPNVFLASRRIAVRWGTYKVLEPEIVCMKDLLKYKWKYFINLTGQEFPLKTNWELVKILKAYNGANDIEKTRYLFLCLSKVIEIGFEGLDIRLNRVWDLHSGTINGGYQGCTKWTHTGQDLGVL